MFFRNMFSDEISRKTMGRIFKTKNLSGRIADCHVSQSSPIIVHNNAGSVDISQAHPNLDEIEREKVCSVMDPLKLSAEARLHASQNKRLPVQIVLHALYFDQLKLRSGADDRNSPANALTTRSQLQADASLVKENEELRSELMRMKMYISDMQKGQGTTSMSHNKSSGTRRPTFFSSMSKTLGKLNPFRHGSKDTSHIEDAVDITKPRRRRFSVS